MARDDGSRLGVIRRLATERGILEGNKAWVAIAGATWAIRGWQLATRKDESFVVEDLLPGEQLVISHHPPTKGRKGRKRRRARERVEQQKDMAAEPTRRERKLAAALERQRRSAEKSGKVRKARKLAARAERARLNA